MHRCLSEHLSGIEHKVLTINAKVEKRSAEFDDNQCDGANDEQRDNDLRADHCPEVMGVSSMCTAQRVFAAAHHDAADEQVEEVAQSRKQDEQTWQQDDEEDEEEDSIAIIYSLDIEYFVGCEVSVSVLS